MAFASSFWRSSSKLLPDAMIRTGQSIFASAALRSTVNISEISIDMPMEAGVSMAVATVRWMNHAGWGLLMIALNMPLRYAR